MNDSINSRGYTSFHPLDIELKKIAKPCLFDLGYSAMLHVEGPKSAEFLQGQLSCDMRLVTHVQMQQGVMCNLKGRVLAILDVIHDDSEGFFLTLPADLLPITQASLAKTALFSRVQIYPHPWKVLGLYVPEGMSAFDWILPHKRYAVTHQAGIICYKTDDCFYELLVEPECSERERLCKPFIQDEQYAGSLAWHALQLQHLRAEIYPESRGLFLPHHLEMHKTGYLNFEKGCYKGQEIVARMHYRGTQKYQLVWWDIQRLSPLILGQPLNDKEGKPIVAELIDYCPMGKDKIRILGIMVAKK